MKILVTGGSGYIGAHVCMELLEKGYKVIALDNLCNSKIDSLNRVAKLKQKKLRLNSTTEGDFFFEEIDIRSRKGLKEVFKNHKIEVVIHCAGLKSVEESIDEPLLYFDNNLNGSISLFKSMIEANVNNIIFSSSATVYGEPKIIPITEDCPTSTPLNPYGNSKLMIEKILMDLCKRKREFKAQILRYFNPVGAHSSAEIGEDPIGVPSNLFPLISRVALGIEKELKIYGNDYSTKDGTGVRDYIHVVDLAKGHLAALDYLLNEDNYLNIFNLGAGKGFSVLEVVEAFQAVTRKKIPYKIVDRRSGDIAECWASTEKANKILNWQAKRSLHQACEDTWEWLKKNEKDLSRR